MSYSVYRVKSSVPGVLYLRYHKGQLTNIELPEDMDPSRFDGIMSTVPQFEEDVVSGACTHVLMVDGQFDIRYEEIKGRTIREKVIWFCTAYKHHRGTHYTAKDNEKANLKHVPVSKELLDTFFASPLQHYTIDNYISRINITRDWAANGIPSRDRYRFPDHWDPELEKRLTGKDLQDYHQHLTKSGWIKDYNPTRGTMWVEKRTK